jgi:hypothetical protein
MYQHCRVSPCVHQGYDSSAVTGVGWPATNATPTIPNVMTSNRKKNFGDIVGKPSSPRKSRTEQSSNLITSLLRQAADSVMSVTSLNRRSSTYPRENVGTWRVLRCSPKRSSSVWCCLQPQRLWRRLVLLPTHLAALTSNVMAALRRLSDVPPTVGNRSLAQSLDARWASKIAG